MTEAQSFSSSAFSPAAARQTSVALLRNVATGDHRLVTSISTRKSTEVLRINLRSGRLELENDRWAESSYENESEALDHLQGRGFEVAERGYALLGYAVAGHAAGLLLATRVREKAVLPGGHTVYAVTDSQWAIVPLQNEAADAAAAAALAGLPPPKDGAMDFWRALQQFTLNNAHYYCETADISRPFPSDCDPRDPNPEFVWNSWLRQPLVELGLYDHCPALLQGAVECSTQALPGGSGRFSMCLISRRSRRHPGTRYIARGLNSMAGPGNEIECELLTWTHPEQRHFARGSWGNSSSASPGPGSFTTTSFSGLAGSGGSFSGMPAGGASGAGGFSSSSGSGGGEALRWARVVWRRGTVPIWWGVQLQSLAQGLQAEVYVREEHPYHGTASYFRNVQRQHTPRPAIPAGTPGISAAGSQQQQGAGAAAVPELGSGAGAGAGEGWTLVDDGAEGSTGRSAGGAVAAAAAGQRKPSLRQQQQGQGQAGSEEEAVSQCVSVTCINLLHANPKKASELMLSSHFQDAMRHVRRRLGGEAPIKVVNFDWHGNMARLSEEKAVEGFWSLMEPFVKQTGFAWGWMEPHADRPAERRASSPPAMSGGSSGAASCTPGGSSSRDSTVSAGPTEAAAGATTAAEATTAWPPCWRMRWGAQQSGLLRFNCADSLDRTNAATCFAILPVLQEQLRVLGVALECGSSMQQPGTAALLRSRQRSSAGDVAALANQQQQQQGQEASDAAAGGLPEGWEVRQHEGRLLYIDHINKTTQWTPPTSAAAGAAAAGAAAGTAGAAGAAAPAGSGSRPGSRPGSGAPLSARMFQSASDMLARLQQRSAASPGSSSGAGLGSGGPAAAAAGGGSVSPAKGTPLQHLERRSSPPRMPPASLERRSSPPRAAPADGASSSSMGGFSYWSRNSSSGSLNGVPHAASAPDVSLASRPTTATSEAPSSPGGPEWDPRRPWAFFDYDINDVRERLYREAVSDYVEMFRVHGDIHSFLYTGSPAMHSHVLNLVVQGGKGYGATSGVGKLQNLRVAVQRRWNNTMSDTSRQQAMELFLGLRIQDTPDQKGYFPGLQVLYRDATQLQLGGMEPFEHAPLPPSHSRHASASSGLTLGPLGAGAAEAGTAVAAAAAGGHLRLPLLEEEVGAELAVAEGGGQGGHLDLFGAPAEAGQEQQEGDEGSEDDRAHAVPGVPAVEHDGVLGVRQTLLDLEPLQDFPQLEQQGQQQQQGRSSESVHHMRSSSSVESVPSGSGALLPGSALDPLGALLHPAVTDRGAAAAGQGGEREEELISLDCSAEPSAPHSHAAMPGDVRSQLEDLLL